MDAPPIALERSIDAFLAESRCEGIVTGSANLRLRGLVNRNDDVDIIVPGVEALDAVIAQYGILDVTQGTIAGCPAYEARLLYCGVPFEIWRESGPGLPIPSIDEPRANERVSVGGILLPLRPLRLLLVDYGRAASSTYPVSAAKRGAYAERIRLIGEAIRKGYPA